MLKRDLLELITNGESSTVEFKRDDVRPEQLAKEFVSFLNLKGGRVLIGVEDDGAICGIRKGSEELQRWIMDVVFGRYVYPQVIPEYEEIALDDGKRIAVVTVEMGVLKPYVLRHSDRDDIYIRVGNIATLAKREQQMRLIESGGFLHVEALPISSTSLSNLDKRRLGEYLVRIAGDTSQPESDEKWVQRLSNLDLLKKTEFGDTVCTLAGILLFANQPRGKYPFAGIRVLVFPGKEKDYNALRDEWISVPIVQLHDYDDKGGRVIIQEDIITQSIVLLQAYISEEKLIGAIRQRVWQYPVEAIREILVNAIAHRDYTKAVEIEIGVYTDRLEVISPGAPPNGQTKEKMLAGQRIARNPIIAEIMRDYGLGERRGMGLRRKVVPLMLDHNGVEPILDVTEDNVRIVLPKKFSP
jgi:ATP-dependent DNA helicase RecG